jgi:NAD(P)H dehydrogenase (quinone)
MKVLIVYYSMYGHIHRMAMAVAAGANEVSGSEVLLRRVPETLSEEILGKMGAIEAQKSMVHIQICTVGDLESADAVIFGTPTRFGNMCGQMRQFLDATGGLWQKGALVGKVGSVFASSATQHGGPGVDDPQFPHHPASPGIYCSGAAIHLSGTDEDR